MKSKVQLIFPFLVILITMNSCFKSQEYPLYPIISEAEFFIFGDSAQLSFSFTDGDGDIGDDEVFLGQDSRPNIRLSGGINVQTFYSVSDRVVVRPRYKFFADDWGVMSHQLGGKMSIKVTDWLMLAPGYSWYTQQGANFFIDPKAADPTFASTGYATSDIRLGDFNANAYELGVSVKLSAKWRMNALAAYYEQSNGYASRWWAVGVTYEY